MHASLQRHDTAAYTPAGYFGTVNHGERQEWRIHIVEATAAIA
jgi:hypothetical protein